MVCDGLLLYNICGKELETRIEMRSGWHMLAVLLPQVVIIMKNYSNFHRNPVRLAYFSYKAAVSSENYKPYYLNFLYDILSG